MGLSNNCRDRPGLVYGMKAALVLANKSGGVYEDVFGVRFPLLQ